MWPGGSFLGRIWRPDAECFSFPEETLLHVVTWKGINHSSVNVRGITHSVFALKSLVTLCVCVRICVWVWGLQGSRLRPCKWCVAALTSLQRFVAHSWMKYHFDMNQHLTLRPPQCVLICFTFINAEKFFHGHLERNTCLWYLKRDMVLLYCVKHDPIRVI